MSCGNSLKCIKTDFLPCEFSRHNNLSCFIFVKGNPTILTKQKDVFAYCGAPQSPNDTQFISHSQKNFPSSNTKFGVNTSKHCWDLPYFLFGGFSADFDWLSQTNAFINKTSIWYLMYDLFQRSSLPGLVKIGQTWEMFGPFDKIQYGSHIKQIDMRNH